MTATDQQTRPKAAQKRGGAKRTQAERTAESDKRLLDAAAELILAHGTHRTTLKEIGERAGYSRGLANFRFGSKEALFSEMLRLYNRRWKQEASDFIGDRTGLDAFRSALDGVTHFVTTDAKFMRSMHILYYETLASSQTIRQRLSEQHAAYRADIAKYVAQAIKDGDANPDVEPDRVAVQFCSFVFGLVYQWLVAPDSVNIEEAISDYSRNMIKLISSR